tara:strand:+ start:2309 stop:2656 length:348 start_codon:yes stop_codon:yes gene_type:complete
MEIELKHSERIALIDSAVELVTIFANRPPAITSELRAYEAALAFLQMRYELEKPVVVMQHPKEPSNDTEHKVWIKSKSIIESALMEWNVSNSMGYAAAILARLAQANIHLKDDPK